MKSRAKPFFTCACCEKAFQKSEARSVTYCSMACRISHNHTKTASGCWESTKKLHHSGYVYLSLSHRVIPAHRASYEAFKGPIPKGMCVCHSCDNRCCVNPDHLFAGTQKENVHDMITKGRRRPDWTFKGSPHPNAKLSTEQVLEIKRLREEGLFYKDIAPRFGVTPSACRLIVVGKRRGHGH